MPLRRLRADEVAAAPQAGAVRTVLVVDDSRAQRRILSAYLGRLGLAVVEAGTAEEALQSLARGSVDMIVSDWMMPGMSGPEFCRRLRQLPRDGYVYVILLTAKAEKDEIAAGLDAGADDFLSKPVRLDELRARIAAGERILRMERELTHRNRVATAALAELRVLYDSLDRDLIEARKLQQSLVRERRRVLPEGEVNLLLQPSGHVGGDLVGFFPTAPRGLGLYSIDVSGHGVASALLAARLAAHLGGGLPGRNLALHHEAGGPGTPYPPEKVAALLNRLLLEEVETGHYVTLLYAIVDLRTGVVQMVQAGHPAPLVQAADGAMRAVGQGGLPVGLLADAQYERVCFTLARGERLLILSDGFSECPDPSGRLLEEAGVMRLVGRLATVRGGALLEALVRDLARWAPDGEFPDDLSAVLFEYSGQSDLPWI